MDYKKSNAPTNTVTRDIMNLCKDTGNIYETIAIIGKRANQISHPLPITWTRCLRIASRLKSHASTSVCPSPRSLPLRSS